MADEQIIVSINVKDQDVKDASKNIHTLTESIEELSNSITTARNQNKEYKKQQKDLNKLYLDNKISSEKYNKEVDKLNVKIRDNNKFIATSTVEMQKQKRERTANIKLVNKESDLYTKLSAKLTLARKKARELGIQYGVNSKQFKEAAKGVRAMDTQLKTLDDKLGQNQRSVGKYTNALKGLGTQLLGAAGITIGIQGLITAGQKFYEQSVKLIEITSKVTTNFGLVGKAAKEVASDILAISDVFQVDYNETLLAANAVSKELGITAQEALRHIEEGFLKGSNNSGEFLNILKEYPVQMKKAGINANEFFAIVNQQVTAGVYTDKGIDSIKEAGIALQENTKAVQEALEPLGDTVSLEIKRLAATGESFKAMQLLTKSMDEGNLTASETQTIMSDIFKGAGEDAESFVLNLHNIEGSLENVAIQATASEQASLNLSKSWNRFVSSVSSSDGIFSKTWATFKNLLASAVGLLTELIGIVSGSDKAIDKVRSAIDKITASQKDQTVATEDEKKKQLELADAERKSREQQKENAKEREKEAKERAKQQEKALQREQEAAEKLLEINNEKKLALIEDEEELRAAMVQIEVDALTASLENQELGEIEKRLMHEVTIEKINKINEDFDKKEKKRQKDLLKRKDKAAETIQELDDELTLSQIDNAVELKDKLIELEKAKLAALLADENLLAIERTALRRQTEANIQNIEREFAEQKKIKDKEDYDNLKALVLDSFSEITNITAKFAGEEIAMFGRISEGMITAFENGKISAEGALKGIDLISKSVFESMSERRKQELDEIEAARARELELAGDNKDAQDDINRKYDEKQKQAKLKQFKIDKALALVQIAVSTAIAAVKTAGQLGFPLAIPFVAAVVALGAINAALVATKRPPSFGGGTDDIVNIGSSHASGNDVDVWGYAGSQKQYLGKVEKGEAMPVIRKSAVNDYQIAKLNGQFNDGGRVFQEGTNDITAQEPAQNNQLSVDDLVFAFSQINLGVKVEDITKEISKKVEVVDNSKV